MEADLHALALLALTILPVVLLGLAKRRRPTDRQLIFALGTAVGVALVAWMLNHHLCREGTPRNQWLIPCLLLFLVLAFVQAKRRRRITGAIIAAGMIGLSFHFTELVHSSEWTANPRWDGGAAALERAMRARFEDWVEQAPDREIKLPAGWVDELPPWDPQVKETMVGMNVYRRDIERVWHTRLTGLYRCRLTRQELWHAGGPLADATSQLEMRDRPAKND